MVRETRTKAKKKNKSPAALKGCNDGGFGEGKGKERKIPKKPNSKGL
jgi:hypothetical protein